MLRPSGTLYDWLSQLSLPTFLLRRETGPCPQASLPVNTATSESKGLQSPSSSPSKEGKMQAKRQGESRTSPVKVGPSGSQVQTCPAVRVLWDLPDSSPPQHTRPAPAGSCRQRERCRCLICFKGKKKKRKRKCLILYKIVSAHKDRRGSGISVSENILQHQATRCVPPEGLRRRWLKCARLTQSPGEPGTLSLKCTSCSRHSQLRAADAVCKAITFLNMFKVIFNLL